MLFLSRADYAVSVLGVYSFLLFVHFFSQKKIAWLVKKRIAFIFPIVSLLIISVYVFTDSIISSLVISNNWVYREVFGRYAYLHLGFHAVFIASFVYVVLNVVHKQTYLDKIRLKNIVVLFFTTILILFLFQLLLPYFWIWIFEREIVLLFFFFVLGVIFTIKRYYFPRIGYGIGKILNVIISFISSVVITNFIQLIYNYSFNKWQAVAYWSSEDPYNVVLISSSIVLFLFSYFLLDRFVFRRVFWLSDNAILKVFTWNLQKNISRITTFWALQSHIQKELKSILGSDFCRIVIYKNDTHFREMKQYFETAKGNPIFINDMVFLEENGKFFDKEKIMNEIPKETALIFPFYDETRTNTGLFILWQKPFGDFYTIDEIESLRQVVLFIESHLRYLNTYEQIQEFSQTLDKRVDEKTIEYNDLINRQKEFISTISHEIKSPIAGAILQTDSIMDDIDNEKISRPKIKEELNLLSVQLVKVGDLLSKLFSAQYYDTHAVTLFREKVQIQNMLNMELDIYESIYEGAEFIRKISSDMKFIEIDKIQFQQVVTNLITNALKFSQPTHPVVQVEAYIKSWVFHFSVEDNGDGFAGIDISEIFDKYAVGSSESVWLGIWLYLCKRIVEMHEGKISASKSKDLGGAKISIVIPI